MTKAKLKNLVVAIKIYEMTYGIYPSSTEGLAVLQRIGLVPEESLDYWRNKIRYQIDEGDIILTSEGSDAISGTKDDIVLRESIGTGGVGSAVGVQGNQDRKNGEKPKEND